jgi:hypothetical protein
MGSEMPEEDYRGGILLPGGGKVFFHFSSTKASEFYYKRSRTAKRAEGVLKIYYYSDAGIPALEAIEKPNAGPANMTHRPDLRICYATTSDGRLAELIPRRR